MLLLTGYWESDGLKELLQMIQGESEFSVKLQWAQFGWQLMYHLFWSDLLICFRILTRPDQIGTSHSHQIHNNIVDNIGWYWYWYQAHYSLTLNSDSPCTGDCDCRPTVAEELLQRPQAEWEVPQQSLVLRGLHHAQSVHCPPPASDRSQADIPSGSRHWDLSPPTWEDSR